MPNSRPPGKLAVWLFPELRALEDRETAQYAVREAQRRAKRHWTVVLRVIDLSAWSFLGTCVLFRFIPGLNLIDPSAALKSILGIESVMLELALVAAIVGMLLIAPFWIFVPVERRFLRQWLNENGYPTCLKCGYNLTGNESSQCPECGTPVSTTDQGRSE